MKAGKGVVQMQRFFRLTFIYLLATGATGLSASQSLAQETETTDSRWLRLSTASVEETLEPGRYKLTLLDLIPGRTYLVNQTTIKIEPATPDFGSGLLGAGADPDPLSDQPTIPAACNNVTTTASSPPLEEKQISKWLNELNTQLTECRKSSKNTTVVAQLAKLVSDTAALTQRTLDPVEITKSTGVLVTVARVDSAKTWEFKLTPPTEKNWFVSYGLQAVPDEDERYFAKAAGTNDNDIAQFEIAQLRRGSEEYDVNGVVLFTYLGRAEQWGWRSGWSGGLSINSNDLSFFVGPSLALKEFLFITGGIAFHQQDRLNGALEPGEIVTTNLTSEQLHSQTHDFNWFVGVSMAFRNNPFKATSGDKETKVTKKPQPEKKDDDSTAKKDEEKKKSKN